MAKFGITGIVFTFLLYVNITSCSDINKGNVTEGVIEFNVSCLDPENAFCALSPTRAKLSFKNDKFKMEMSAFSMFKTAIIGNNTKHYMLHTVDFMDMHKYCKLERDEINAENKNYQLKFKTTGKTKTILGFKAHQVIATPDNPKATAFEIWYTNDIPLPESNTLNPYAEIKGVLLEYRIRKMDTEMLFIANHFESQSLSDSIFNLNTSYEKVSYSQIKSIFEDFK